MVFAINLIYSIFLSYRISHIYKRLTIKKNFLSYFVTFFPVWLTWLLICGGQYEVGTDYSSYYTLFQDFPFEYYLSKGEWLFSLIVMYGGKIGIPPQGFFFVFYFINFLFFFLSSYYLDRRSCFIWILLFITLSNVFNNQLNGLRQYSAIYILSFAIISYSYNRSLFRCLFLIILASGLHASALLSLPILFIFRINYIRPLYLYFFLIAAATVSLFGNISSISNSFLSFLPANYAFYLDSEFNSSNSPIKILTKLIFIPIYLMSIVVLNVKSLSPRFRSLYYVGIFSYILRLLFLENIIFNRIGQLFVLLSVLPIFFYLRYLILYKHEKLFLILLLVFVSFYMLKTLVFPSGEYLYNSIYLR